MVKCPKCGLEVNTASNFCPHCGVGLSLQGRANPNSEIISEVGKSLENNNNVPAESHTNYIRNSPPDTKTERVIFECYPSLKLVNLKSIGLFALFIIIAIIAVIVKSVQGISLFSGVGSLEVLILIVGLIITGLYYGYQMFLSYSNHYKLTSQRIFITTGLLNKQIDEIELEKYKDILVRQTFVDKFINCGDIDVMSADASCPVLKIPYVDDPINKKELIRTAARERKSSLGITRREEI